MNADRSFSDDERKRLQSQSAEIATLAGGLAHEIRNPLSTISLNLELMAEDLEQTDGSQRDRRLLNKVNLLQRECRQLDQILTQFLQFARLGELHRVESDWNAIVREFIESYQMQADDAGVEISPHLATDLPAVWIDQALIRQAILNLAINAQQAMPDGGTLELLTYADGEFACLDVIDTGVGMHPDMLDRMFRPFFSSRKGGSGLGLPTVKRIVEAHDGKLTCESEVGRGTRFRICIPILYSPK
ncbi:sensor histidine kinase [Thalassoroseus pseudoceratinae]|uniref:sensor histidine kinase n=1 Tax=Thalassoroseus pseudoceratinae TaxID=2713176 RepID=UPI00141E87B8|nr:ATP-binding protein [Thalassoroseus pseudoceratinae]